MLGNGVQNSHELYTYEVDEFEHVCGANYGGSTQLQLANSDGELGYFFANMFADSETRALFTRILDHVRSSSETTSFPFRCDSETHRVYQRCVVFMSSSRRVAFVNRLIGMDPRPSGVRWVRHSSDSNSASDFACCSMCNRLKVQEQRWIEFEQLVDEKGWASDGASMQCLMTVCGDCESGVLQRLHESQRPQGGRTTLE